MGENSLLKFLTARVYQALPRLGAIGFGFHPTGPGRSPKRLSLPVVARHRRRSEGFFGRLSLPCLVVDELFFLLGGLCYPAGSGDSEIRRSVTPNDRRVRWLPASSSQ